MTRKSKSTPALEQLGTDTSDDLFDEDDAPDIVEDVIVMEDQPGFKDSSTNTNGPLLLTFRARVLLERLLRVLALPEGYPEREAAVQRHVDALLEEGHEVIPTRGHVEQLLGEGIHLG